MRRCASPLWGWTGCRNHRTCPSILENASQYGYRVINPPQYFELRQTAGAYFEEAALGKISSSEALAEAVAVWEEGLKDTPEVKIL